MEAIATRPFGRKSAFYEQGLYDLCALLCQQAAEKAVKAVWIDVKGEEAPKIHRVANLALELGAPQEVAMATNVLFGDYAASRYPDIAFGVPYESYTEVDAQDRLEKAEAVLEWAKSQWESEDETA